MWLEPIIALLAELLTSFTPCSLSSVPLVVGYIGGAKIQILKELLNYLLPLQLEWLLLLLYLEHLLQFLES